LNPLVIKAMRSRLRDLPHRGLHTGSGCRYCDDGEAADRQREFESIAV
jgi:elongation factor P hydroxylase